MGSQGRVEVVNTGTSAARHKSGEPRLHVMSDAADPDGGKLDFTQAGRRERYPPGRAGRRSRPGVPEPHLRSVVRRARGRSPGGRRREAAGGAPTGQDVAQAADAQFGANTRIRAAQLALATGHLDDARAHISAAAATRSDRAYAKHRPGK